MKSDIYIYTDGSSIGNPGPGGYGVVIKMLDCIKEISKGFYYTTNNRMELLAVIISLEYFNTSHQNIILYTDSKYVVNAINNKWLFSWKRSKFSNIKNKDLWTRFLWIYFYHKIDFVWIKGHNNNYYNDLCHKLAFEAASSNNLIIDYGYAKIH